MGERDAACPEGSWGELVATLLGQPRARRLDVAQRNRLQRSAHEAKLLYPDRPDLQECAIEAAIDYLHHTADLEADGAEWRRIREEEKRLGARVRQLAVMSVADKALSERRAASVIFVDRMRLRRWSGKGSGTRQTKSARDSR